MFLLQEKPIDVSQIKNQGSSQAHNGALVTFEGTVRADQVQDRTVSELLYVANHAAVVAEGEKIIKEALSQFPITGVVCIQRIGRLKTTETAIWIGVWASHRDEAYKASRYIIEEIKKRLLIWKKEFYTDGSNAWIHPTKSPLNF